MDSPNLVIPLLVALVLGLRHALDPDHLMAVTTLVAGSEEDGPRRAARLGTIWGTGHALAVVVLGLPIVFFQAVLPEPVQRGTETAIGVVIVLLAARLLRRWRHGAFHLHAHEHGGASHVHVHAHRGTAEHGHEHVRPRTPLQAFLIGVTHGIGGSAPVALLLLASMTSRPAAAVALLIFAAGTAVSMGALSGTFGWLLSRPPLRHGLRLAVVPLGLAGLAFGALYAVGA